MPIFTHTTMCAHIHLFRAKAFNIEHHLFVCSFVHLFTWFVILWSFCHTLYHYKRAHRVRSAYSTHAQTHAAVCCTYIVNRHRTWCATNNWKYGTIPIHPMNFETLSMWSNLWYGLIVYMNAFQTLNSTLRTIRIWFSAK